MNIIVAQIIGVFAVIFFIFSIQYKEKYKILFLQAFANALYAIQYLFLNVYTASLMNIVSFFRCLLFGSYDLKKKKLPTLYLIIFIMIIIILGIINYNGMLSLIPVVITILYVIGSYNDTKYFRIIFLICGIIWLYYNFTVKAYTSLIGNFFEITSGIVSLVRYRNPNKK